MSRIPTTLFAVLSFAAAATSAFGREQTQDPQHPAAPVPFPTAAIWLEYNATDADAEAVITVEAEARLTELEVFAPNRDRVLHLTARDGETLGLSEIDIESAEPNLAEVRAAFPAGTYRFRARTVDGRRLASDPDLTHEVPEAPVILLPQKDAVDVPLASLAVSWMPTTGDVRYEIEVETEDETLVLHANVPPSAHSLALPSTWAQSDTAYVLDVTAVNREGNRTSSELRFHTGR